MKQNDLFSLDDNGNITFDLPDEFYPVTYTNASNAIQDAIDSIRGGGTINLRQGRYEMVHPRYESRLERIRDNVNVNRIGLQGGTYTGFTSQDVRAVEDAVTRYGVAQAIVDGLAADEAGLQVRDILPDRDFNTLRREWHHPTYEGHNENKVICIYGVRAPIEPEPINATQLVFRRNGINTVDIWQTEILDSSSDRAIMARTPILYKRGDHVRIEIAGHRVPADNLMLLGKVIEPLGQTINGEEAYALLPRLARGRSPLGWYMRRLDQEIWANRENKGWELVKNWIGPHVLPQLNEIGYIDIQSKLYPGRFYRVFKNPEEKVEMFVFGRKRKLLCAVSPSEFVTGDRLANRILQLMINEKYFLENANEFDVY